jgi:hypothetical protein
MNLLVEVASWLASTSTGITGTEIGPGVSTAYPVYRTRMPASTGNFYTLYQYGGMAPEPIAGGTIDNPRLQVRTVSAATSDSGYYAALTAQNRLRFVCNRTIPTSTGSYYLSIVPVQAPESMGADSNDRMHWVQNFQVQVSYSA